MSKIRRLVLRVGILFLFVCGWSMPASVAHADGAPQLVVSQFKITSSNGQFITLYNQTDSPLDLTQFELDYISSSNKLTSLPMTGQLPARAYYILSDDQVKLCYQATIASTSLSLSTTSGTLQIWHLNASKTNKELQDAVTWASKASAGAVTLPEQNSAGTVSLLRQPIDALGSPEVAAFGAGTWQAVQPDPANACNLQLVMSGTSAPTPTANPGNRLGIGPLAPSTIVSLAISNDDVAAVPVLPAADVGLNAPQITELLPNPDGIGNDGTEEFIELYNPNAAPFDLAGFKLQTGNTTKHTYTFPAGTILDPQGFTIFYSVVTGLSLSNGGGQAGLLDPFGNDISHSDVYGTAKDGQAWAAANGKWYWTTQQTPGEANVIKQPTATKKSTKSSSSKTAGDVKGTSTASGTSTGQAAVTNSPDSTPPAPVHTAMLAVVVLAAVAYGVYEYRHDLANRFHEFRANRANRREARA